MTLLAPAPVFHVPVLDSIPMTFNPSKRTPPSWAAGLPQPPLPKAEKRGGRRGGRVCTAPRGRKSACSVRNLLGDAFTKAPKHVYATFCPRLQWGAQRRKSILGFGSPCSALPCKKTPQMRRASWRAHLSRFLPVFGRKTGRLCTDMLKSKK